MEFYFAFSKLICMSIPFYSYLRNKIDKTAILILEYHSLVYEVIFSIDRVLTINYTIVAAL
jgi:hypothetical protein